MGCQTSSLGLFIFAMTCSAYATAPEASKIEMIKKSVMSGNASSFHPVGNTKPTKQEKKYLMVQMTCPRAATGRFEMISRNRLGKTQRYRIEYVQGKAISIQISYRKNDESVFVDALKADLTSTEPSSSSLELMAGREFVSLGNEKLREICNGSADARKKFRATLETNHRILRLVSKDYVSNF